MSSFAPNKRLGQHFLSDTNILSRIADAVDAAPGDVVLEIGAGEGSLTRVVAPRVTRVIAIERDRRLAQECGMRNAECGIDNVQLVTGDALRIDWHTLLIPHSAFRTPHSSHSAFRPPYFKVVGNIPYAITTPLIEKALTPPLPERIVFLVQGEVADRLAARPGTKAYGGLSVGVQVLCTVEKLFTVKAGAFRPPPKVTSAVVRLVPRAEPLVPLELTAALRAFTTACFSARRKQLKNAVARATGRPAAAVVPALGALGLDPTTRPERLAPQDFVRLLLWSREL